MSEIAAKAAGVSRFVELPRFLRAVQGREAFQETLRELCEATGFERLFIATGETVSHEFAVGAMGGLSSKATVRPIADNSAAEVSRLATDSGLLAADAVLAIGGGKAIDVAKAACHAANKPVISCPTQLTNDGIVSPVAVIRSSDGIVESLPGRLPLAVVCDLDLVASAPPETARAGLGDLTSNMTAVRDWRLAAAAGSEEVDDFAAMLARSAAELALGADLSSLADGKPDRESLEHLLQGLALSGIAMDIAGSSRPCSGAEHLISHALDRIAPGTALHGEQVAFGTIVAARLHEMNWHRLRERLLAAGLDRAVAGFGLPRETLVQAIRTGPSTRPGRHTILDEVDLSPTALNGLLDELLA